jgi:hypothetical protein
MATGSAHRELTIKRVANGRFGVIRSRGGRISCTGLSPSAATRTEPSIATRTEPSVATRTEPSIANRTE